jgi:hypothetical protein
MLYYTIDLFYIRGRCLHGFRGTANKYDMITLRWDFGKMELGGMNWIHLAQDRGQWRVLTQSNEPSGSMKCWDILEQLSNWQLLKDSAPQGWLVSYQIYIYQPRIQYMYSM